MIKTTIAEILEDGKKFIPAEMIEKDSTAIDA
jgi:hypothetical protein